MSLVTYPTPLGWAPDIARLIRPSLLALACALSWCVALADDRAGEDLAEMTLEQLANVRITSVSKQPQPLSDAAASIYVIPGDRIHRSGATTLPEALRLVPVLHVARADANQYAISTRGFNSVLTNKMLVLIDGRVVYSPLFSGVFWEAQEVVLPDVERIEVISGPGGTLWGTNAVNGIINVITRPASQTRGVLASATGGGDYSGGVLRYGGSLGQLGSYRVYGTLSRIANSERADGIPIRDASERALAGFRADWATGPNSFSVVGGAQGAEIDQVPETRDLLGGHLLGAWTRDLGQGRTMRLQTYWDHTERDQPGAILDVLDTYDVEFHHALTPHPRHRLVWGAGYRRQADRVANLGPGVAFLPPNRELDYLQLFGQDDVRLCDRLGLVLGLRLEHNEYTGVELLPTARLGWKVLPGHLLWGAASRAVRAPSRIDRELFIPATPPFLVLAGGPSFDSEILYAYELGYRGQPAPGLSFALTGFVDDYDRLRSLEPSAAGPVFENRLEATLGGLEAWAHYRVLEAVGLDLGVMRQSLHVRRGDSQDPQGVAALGNDPRYLWKLRAEIDVTSRIDLDLGLRRVGALPQPQVPAYTAFNARLAWRPIRTFEVSVAGKNVFEPGHPEWGAPVVRPEVEPEVWGQVQWRW